MAKINNTPADFWLSLPLFQLMEWIKDSNYIVAKAMEKRN